MTKILPKISRLRSGLILPFILIPLSFIIIASVAWISLNISNINQVANQNISASALSVAEAGVNYYLWHLAHDSTDYQDGTGGPGPYIHDYKDSSGNVIGQYTLTITPPPLGSSTTTVEAVGQLTGSPQTRKIVAQLGIPSFARYAIIANEAIRFGWGTEVFGPLHSNGGIRFDGIAHDIVTSAVADYDDPDHDDIDSPEHVWHSDNNHEFGVHTHRDPPPPDPNPNWNNNFRPLEAPPNSVPDRPDVFLAGRQFPVPSVDFNGITADLADLRTKAQIPGEGFYQDHESDAIGYRIRLREDDRFDIYKVTATTAQCSSVDTYGITTEEEVSLNHSFPTNGIIFVEDQLWVEGKIDTAQLTIVAAKIGGTPEEKSIIVNNDIEYTNDDGSDKLGLIAQKDISIGLYSEDDLHIDAALLAQKGRIGRYSYNKSCNSTYWQRNQIIVNGSLGTAKRYGFRTVCGDTWTRNDPAGCDNGYENRELLFDENLTITPPPSFPTTGSFTILTWKEKD